MKKVMALIGLVTLCMAGAAIAAEDTFVPLGSTWSYLDNGSDQGTAWVAPAFDDSSWSSGPAQLGYGDGDEATVVSFGGVNNAKFTTTYFRHTFNVPNATGYTVLRLRVRRDDGVVVYLNGNEVFRSNLFGDPITFDTFAQNAGDDGNTLLLSTVNPALLLNGDNVLAAEIHQDSFTSSDISFDLEFTGSTDNSAPSVSLLSPQNNTFFVAPADIQLRAAASDPDGNLTLVEFFSGTTKLGEDSTDPFDFQWNGVPVGIYEIYATATDALNLRTTSSVAAITVAASTPPVVVSQDPVPGSVSILTQLTVTFSEVVSGVDAADLLVNGRPATSVLGSGAVYTFSFAQPQDGIVFIAWDARHGIVDTENPPRPFNEYEAGASWQYSLADAVAPTAQINPAPGATLRELDRITIHFSEPVNGVDAADLRINNVPATGVKGHGSGPYEFEFSEPVSGAVAVSWMAGADIRDFSGAANAFAGGSWSYTLDTAAIFKGQVVINEIMYHPASDRDDEEWVELHNRGTNAVNLTGWQLSRGADFVFPNVSLPAGGYLVVAANAAAFNAAYPGVPNVVGGWTGRLSNSGEDIELEDASGERVDIVDYADAGEFGLRRRWTGNPNGWEWYAEHDGLGASLELRNAALDNDQGQNWASSTTVSGTPGAANSVASPNIPPMVLDVAHFPIVPRSTNAITLTTRILDEQATGLAVNLRWRNASTTSPGAFISVTMLDDGGHGDGLAGDGVFGATIVPHVDRTVIEYYVEASDSTANSRTWPAAAQEADSSFAQSANALIQVDDETYAGTQPVYRLIMTESDRSTFASWNRNIEAQFNVTFVAIEGARVEVRHNNGIRYRGAGSRGRNPPTMRLNIVGDNKWNNKSSINLNSQYTHSQVFGGQVSIQSGLPSEYARAVQLRLNGNNPAGAGSPQFGSYAAVEATNGELVGEHLPDDGDGNVYRASTGSHSATLNYLGTNPTSYQQAGYAKTSNASDNDWTDLINLTFAMDPAATPDSDYVAAVRRNVNVDLWLRYFAMASLMEYTETSLASGRGDDYGLYSGVLDKRFIILPHDFDTVFGQGDTGGNINESIYVATAVQTINRFLRHPEFEPLYHAELRRLLATTFTTNNLYATLDQFLGDWVPPQTIQSMKTFIAARNAAVLAQLPPEPVLVRATVSGAPASPTYLDSATLAVGGEGITHYRYRLNGGAFGDETPVATPISLSGLGDGNYTVYVIGRDSAGTWQDQSTPTLSKTWTVLSTLRRVILNEVLARNVAAVDLGGVFPDLIELFNPRATAVDLAGLRLTDDLNAPNRFVFPAGSTIAAGGYLVLLANNPDGTPGIHIGFSLDQNGESLYLLDSAANGGAVLDSVRFGFQLADLSVGRLASGEWALNSPTFGLANIATATASQSTLQINEWLASGVAPLVDDFIELYNPDPLPVAVGGLYLSDLPSGRPFKHEITPLSFMAGFGYKVFIADNNSSAGADHLNFQLSSSIGEIGIIRPDGSVIDFIVYGLQHPGISQGRAPNGGDPIYFLTPPTPGAPNPVPDVPLPPLLVNLLPLNDTFEWRYEESGTDLGSAWTATGFNDSGWPSGPGVFADENPNVPPEPIRTPLNVVNGKITFYFRAHFNVPANMDVSALQVTYAIDDGAVFHLNGVEAGRFNMPNGPVLFETEALGSHEANAFESLNLDMASLVTGDNVIAVEVHQRGFNSSDVVFGMRLDAVVLTNSPTAAGVVINEVLANNHSVTNSDGTVSDWVELRNPSNGAVDLAGMSLTDRTDDSRRWVFPAGSVVPASGFLVVRFDPNLPVTTNSSATLNTGFGLKAGGDAVYLFNRPETGGELLDAITFGIQAADLSIGRIPAGSTSWALTLPTPASANLAAVLGDPSRLKVNEWMADPNSGDDWFEIYNPNPQPVALGDLNLTDDLNDRDKNPIPALSFIAAGLEGYQRFEADNSPEAGADHVNFRLAASGESIGIMSASGAVIDSVTFGPQTKGISEGRLPDGGATIVSFPNTATPGEANFLLLPNIVISEALTHSDLPLEDAIELHNIGTAGVDVSGWYLSDSRNNPRKFVIPANTVIGPGGFVVFYEEQLNLFNPDTPFSLNSAQGDEVHLSQANGSGALTGYRAVARFGAAAPGVSFGRFVTSVGTDFTTMSERTFGEDTPATVEEFRTGTGALNSLPLVGPVVISEIMYHPPGIVTAGVTNDNEIDEFIELHNITESEVTLYDVNHPTNTWRLRDAVDFEFPMSVTLPADGRLLVVSFDPAVNTTALDAFRSTHGIDSSVPVHGPWRGRLANSGENVELYKPDAPQDPGQPDEGFVPYVLADKVKYSDALPWPSLADGNPNGTGLSLQRRVASDYGNDPVNWIAGTPTPGAATGSAALTPPTISNFTADQAVLAGSSATLTVTASGGGALTYEWRLDGIVIPGASAASLTVNNVQAVNVGVYSVLVANGAGAASASTRVDLRSAPVILREPFDQVAVANGSAVFTVLAEGTPDLSYSWSKDDVIVAGAAGPSLVIQNAQFADAVNYRVVISNTYGSVTSSVVTLSIVSPPVIATQPVGTSVMVGQSVSFSVGVLGSAPFHYQWRFNGENISGANSATLTLLNVQVVNSGIYSVRITNVIGSVISADAVLEVTAPPSASVVATDSSASEPGAETGLFTFTRSRVTDEPQQIFFAVTGSAISGSDYVTLSNPVTIPAGADSVTLELNVLDDGILEGDETVIVTVVDGLDYVAGVPTSATVTISDDDNQPPSVVVTSPASGSVVTFGSPITISASANDDGAVTKVEFFANGTTKLGEDLVAPYTITLADAPAGTHIITAVAKDNFGSTGVSAPVTVIVNNPPSVALTSPSAGAIISPGNDITVAATATDGDGSVAQVEFLANGAFLGVDSSSPYSIVWDDVPEGVYQLIARATDNRGTVSTSAVVTITVGVPEPTFGDDFVNRGVVHGFTNTIRGTNVTFTREAGEPRHASRNGNHSGWLNWTAQASGLCRMNTFGSDFDTMLAVYSGNSVSNLTVVAANDDANGDSIQSAVIFNAVAGTSYQIAVDGLGTNSTILFGNVGTIVLNIALPNPFPIFLTQPQSQSVTQGNNVTFSATTAGPGPQTYQWRFNNGNISGQTGLTLTRNNVSAADVGDYTVVASNSSGSTTSAVAVLTIVTAPTITTEPEDMTVSRDADAFFSVSASGLEPISFQWRYNGVAIPGANSSELLLTGVQGREEGAYSVVVSNPIGSTLSRDALLVVDDGLITNTFEVLLDVTNFWRYEASGQDLGTAWRFPDFDDSGWSDGVAMFGYETNPAQYPLPFLTPFPARSAGGANIQTYYLRTPFFVADPTVLSGLVLGAFVDDGAVWYINGREAVRERISDQIPADEVSYDVVASNQNNEGTASNQLLPITNLVAGVNMMSVELHQARLPSSDVVFAMAMYSFGVVTNGPVLSMPEPQSGGKVQLTLTGISGRNYALDVSTDFSNWTPLVTWTNFTGSAQYLDVAPGSPGTRFYRGRLVR